MAQLAVEDEECAEKEISDATAEKYDGALAAVQRLLKIRGVRSYVVHTIVLRLFSDGRPFPLGQCERHAPELVVRSDAGWVASTVTVGPRSGCYLVSIPNGPDLQTVRSGHPEKVANLILAAQPGERA